MDNVYSSDELCFFQEQVTDKTPYTIMFGPDMCGTEHKYHFIIRYRNPKTGLYSEHQAKKTTESLESYFTDKKTHLYTLGKSSRHWARRVLDFLLILVLSSDNSFKMYIDNKLINSGNLLEDMEPAIIPSKEIADETDRKPDDWDEEEKWVVRVEALDWMWMIDLTHYLELLIARQRNQTVRSSRLKDALYKRSFREEHIHLKVSFLVVDWDENAPRDIVDPSATVPKDWLENGRRTGPIYWSFIADLEPLEVPDPEATQPEDW